MAIALTDPNVDVHDTTDLATYTSAPWTPPANALLVLWIGSHADATDPTTVTGHGVTYSNKTAVSLTGATSRLGLWVANSGGSPTSVGDSATWGANRSGCSLVPLAYEGVDLAGGVLAAIVQAPTNIGTGTSGTVTLAAAGSSNNRSVSAVVLQANEAVTPQTNWTELGDGGFTTPPRRLEAQWRSDQFDTAGAASWASSVNWAMIGAEIKASVGGAPVVIRRTLLGVGV